LEFRGSQANEDIRGTPTHTAWERLIGIKVASGSHLIEDGGKVIMRESISDVRDALE
jgi:hypothetical protein